MSKKRHGSPTSLKQAAVEYIRYQCESAEDCFFIPIEKINLGRIIDSISAIRDIVGKAETRQLMEQLLEKALASTVATAQVLEDWDWQAWVKQHLADEAGADEASDA